MDVSLSFWDVQGYKPVLKRINNGAKLCDELVKMIMERWVFAGTVLLPPPLPLFILAGARCGVSYCLPRRRC